MDHADESIGTVSRFLCHLVSSVLVPWNGAQQTWHLQGTQQQVPESPSVTITWWAMQAKALGLFLRHSLKTSCPAAAHTPSISRTFLTSQLSQVHPPFYVYHLATQIHSLSGTLHANTDPPSIPGACTTSQHRYTLHKYTLHFRYIYY